MCGTIVKHCVPRRRTWGLLLWQHIGPDHWHKSTPNMSLKGLGDRFVSWTLLRLTQTSAKGGVCAESYSQDPAQRASYCHPCLYATIVDVIDCTKRFIHYMYRSSVCAGALPFITSFSPLQSLQLLLCLLPLPLTSSPRLWTNIIHLLLYSPYGPLLCYTRSSAFVLLLLIVDSVWVLCLFALPLGVIQQRWGTPGSCNWPEAGAQKHAPTAQCPS